MKNISKARIAPLFRIIALVAVIGFSFAACSDGGGGGGGGGSGGGGGGGGSGSGGTFTITGIPSSLEGMYAYCQGETPEYPNNKITIVGAEKVLGILIVNSPRISGGKVSIPLWQFTLGNSKTPRYSGNDTVSSFTVRFSSGDDAGNKLADKGQLILGSVTFSKGSATKAWSDGTYYPD